MAPLVAAFAAAENGATVDSIDWFPVVAGLLGGLALLLLGLQQLTAALKAIAGDRLRVVLARLTTNRFAGVATGATVTAVVQSSTVTTVLLVGFVDAGLMPVSRSLAVVLGANVGTTVTAQVVAFDVAEWALVLVALGFAATFVGRGERFEQSGTGILGLGLVFFGMQVVSDAMDPLQGYEPFLDLMERLEQPVLGLLAGALFTAVVQSSSATTVVAIALAGQGLIGLEAGIAIVLGSNIGTCVTAVIAAVGKTREAVRVAVAHVLFNVVGALLWLVFIQELTELSRWISPEQLGGAGSDPGSDTPRQLANAHTIFNVANVLLFLPFLATINGLLERLVPDRPAELETVVRPRYLSRDLVSTPALALHRARLELGHLGELVVAMLEAVPAVVLSGSRRELDALATMDDDVDRLYGAIVDYLGEVSRGDLTEEQSHLLLALLELASALENIGDIVETNLVALGRRRLSSGVRISPSTREVIEELHDDVIGAVRDALVGVLDDDKEAARRAAELKPHVKRRMDEALRHETRRLVADEPHRTPAFTIERDILENLRRIYYFARRVARSRLGPTVRPEE